MSGTAMIAARPGLSPEKPGGAQRFIGNYRPGVNGYKINISQGQVYKKIGCSQSHPVSQSPGFLIFLKLYNRDSQLVKNLDAGQADMVREKGKVSYAYRKEVKRPAFAFARDKKDPAAVRFTTLLYPFDGRKPPVIEVTENEKNDPERGVIDISISINGKIREVEKDFSL